MPEDCKHCIFYNFNNQPTCNINGHSQSNNWTPIEQRMPSCPLINTSESFLTRQDRILNEILNQLNSLQKTLSKDIKVIIVMTEALYSLLIEYNKFYYNFKTENIFLFGYPIKLIKGEDEEWYIGIRYN